MTYDVASNVLNACSQYFEGVAIEMRCIALALVAMSKTAGAMQVAKITNRRVDKSGQPRECVSHLLRRTYRDGAKVRHETLAKLSALPAPAIEAVRSALARKTLVEAGQDLEVTCSLPPRSRRCGPRPSQGTGPARAARPSGATLDVALALVVARVVRPGSKRATTRWWADTTLAADLGVADASTDEVYDAMYELAGRQDTIEKTLVRGTWSPTRNPNRLALFDLSSSWVTWQDRPLAVCGYSRNGKKGLPPIEYELLT